MHIVQCIRIVKESSVIKKLGSLLRSSLLASRWDLDSAPTLSSNPLPRFAGNLTAIDHFDAALFSISRSEAAAVDPQQRLLLERTAEAVMCSGAPAQYGVIGEDHVGVFVGLSSTDYAGLTAAVTPAVTGYTATGLRQGVDNGWQQRVTVWPPCRGAMCVPVQSCPTLSA